jgi:hypothetical protein
MATRSLPYAEKEDWEVIDLYGRLEFPSMDGICGILWKIIMNCWHRRYTNASEILQEFNIHERSISVD